MKTPNEQNHPFKTPDGYFDNFTEKLMDVIKTNQKSKSKRILSAWVKYSSIAAVIVIAFIFAAVKIHQNTNLSKSSDTIKSGKNVLIADSGLKFKHNSEQKINYSSDLTSRDLSYDEIIDWSTSMDLNDEELLVLFNNI